MAKKTAEDYAREGYTDPELRLRLKDELMAGEKGGRAGQWSARKSQLLAAEYQRQGGGFQGEGNREEADRLRHWTAEEWQTASGDTQARHGATTERYLPKRAWQKLSPEEREQTAQKKRRASREGRQYVPNTRPAVQARRTTDLEELTRAELYQQAKKRNIAGRSRMDKAALVQALTR